MLTFGSDPEFALADKDNKIVSAIPVLKRSKARKIKLGDGERIYYDNVLTEMNMRPAQNKGEAMDNLKSMFSNAKSYLDEQFGGNQYKLFAVASHTFTDKEISHKKAREFGCDPEFDGYSGNQANPPDVGQARNFRSAGGHIHIGSELIKDMIAKIQTIQLMDCFVGLPLLIVDNDETSPARKQLYGAAGRYRVQKYGVEYRTPSNCWLSRPDLSELVYDLTEMTVEVVKNKQIEQFLDRFEFGEVAYYLNNNDKTKARELLDRLGMPNHFLERIDNFAKEQHKPNVFQNWL